MAISPAAVRRQAARASETGQLGEEAFDQWLRDRGLSDDEYLWVSQTNARAAFDFEVHNPGWENEGGVFYVDVKATKGSHDLPFHMSMAEVRWAAAHDTYRIARVSSIAQESAEVHIFRGVQELCSRLLEGIGDILPEGVSIDSFEIAPGLLCQVAIAPIAL